MRLWLALLLLPLTACSADGDWWASPPDGSRWVGYDGAVVAVPDWWTTGETRCGTPVEDTVYFDSGATVDCGIPHYDDVADEVSSLAVLRDNGRYGADDVDGDCEEWFDGVTAVPLEIGGPGGWTPSWGDEPDIVDDLTAAIEAAGLEVELETIDPDPNGDVADLPPGSLLDVDPQLGTPIEDGGTVVVTVTGTSGP